MKWLGIVAGVVLAGIVGAAVLLPRLIDWQSYRPEIAAIAEEAIGLPVTIDGNIQAELFPTPQLTAGGIRVRDRDGRQDIAAIRWAEARFKFSDLLRGTVTLTSLALVEPVVSLSGELFDHLQAEPNTDRVGGAEGASLGGVQSRAAKRIEIRNGTFTLGGPDNPEFLIERVSGAVENAAVGSRVTVSLAGRVRGRDLELEMRVAPSEQAAPAPIAFTVTDQANASTLRVVGEWSMNQADVGMTGAFSLNGPDIAAVAALTPLSLPSAFAVGGGVRADGNFALDTASSTLQVTDLSANTDALSVTGEASADWSGRPKLDIALRAGRLDLDGFVAPLGDAQSSKAPGKDAPVKVAPGEDAAGEDARGRKAVADPSPGSSVVADAPHLMAWIGTLPADVSLDLSVAGARFRDTIVRRIAVRGSVDRGTVTLEELSAQLPGGTDLSVAGFGDMTGPEPLLEGNATLRADDLRRLLNWAGLPVPDVSADRLRRFSMVSGISLRPRRLDIIDAAVELDGVTASAAAAVALRRRPGLGLRVSIDHINLDAYRSVYAAPAADKAEPAAGNPTAGQAGDPGTSGTAGTPTLWSRFDASLDLRIGRAVALDVPFNDVLGDLVLKDGVLTVNEITFRDAAGVSGQFGGQLSVAGDEDATFFAFEGQSEDMGQVIALLEGPDFVAGLLRSIGPAALNISYRPASDDAPLVFQALGEDGALSIGAALSSGETGEPAVDILSGEMNALGTALWGLAGRMTFPAGAYQLEKLSGTLNGGTLNLSGSLRRRDDGLQQLLITGALDDMKVDRELADLDGPLGLTGTISIRGQAESTGSDWRAMAALNSGWFDMEGSLAVDVGPSRASIVKVRQVSDVRDALREQFSKPASIAGSLVLENGVLMARDLVLRGKTGGLLGLSGRLDMTDLDLSAELVLRKAENAPQFARLIAEGPAKAPNLRLEGAGPAEN